MSTLPEIKTILYATDLVATERTRPVFRHAVGLAKHYNAKIIMLHVMEPLGSTGQAIIDAYLPSNLVHKLEQEGMEELIKTMKSRLHNFCADELGACEQESTLVSEVEVVTGHPAEKIVEAAEAHQADLIVMGNCVHNLLGKSLAGSTTRHVSLHSRIPLLTIPHRSGT